MRCEDSGSSCERVRTLGRVPGSGSELGSNLSPAGETTVKRYEERTTIATPASAVYDYVSDFLRHGEWGGHDLRVVKDDDGPITVGSTFSTTAKQFGTQREHSTITELDPGRVFGWDSTGGLGLVHHRFALAEENGATAVTKSAEFAEPSFLAKLVGWRLNRDVPAGLRSDLAAIKAHLEA
jgi:uncharacterized membrane protein